MKTFEQIKANAVREFCSNYTRGTAQLSNGLFHLIATKQMIDGTFKGSKKMIQDIEDKCVAAIEAVDIRSFKQLMELCPNSFPSYVKNGHYGIEYTDRGFEFYNTSQPSA